MLCGFYAHGAFADYSKSEFQSVTTDKERQLNRIRDAEIQQLSSILRRETQVDRKVDILLRLGRVYTEKYKHYFYKENEIWKIKTDVWLANGSKNKRRKVVPDYGRSKKILGKSLSKLQQLLSIMNRGKKRIKNLDEFYYYLGFSYWRLGQKSNGNTYFERIIKKYKRSNYLPEAYRYVADYSFRKRRFSKAKKYYKKAANYRNLPTYARVLYGLAWTEYKLGNNRSALEYMKKALLEARGFNKEDAAKGDYALDKDVYEAIALFYSESRNYRNATNYFQSFIRNQTDLYEVLYRLLSMYQNQGQYAKAVDVSKQLESIGGSSVDNSESKRFDILRVALKNAKMKKQPLQEVAIIKKMVAEFVNKKIDDETIVEQVKSIVWNAAIYNHNLIKSGNRSQRVMSVAVNFYNLYIAAFSNKLSKDEYYEARYLLADVYLKQGHYQKSLAEYKFLLNESLQSPNSKFIVRNKREISKGLVFVSDIYIKKKKRYSKKELDELLAAIDLYEKNYPGTPEGLQFLSRAAGLLKNDKTRSLEYEQRLKYFINKYPNSPQAMESAVLLIGIAEKGKELNKLLGYTGEFLDNRKLMSQDRGGKFKKDLQKIQSRVQFQLVKEVENKKDFLKAAKSYERLFVKSKDREVREKALNNAAVNYEKAGDIENALRVYRLLLTSNTSFKLDAAERIINNADNLFILEKYDLALVEYEYFYNLYKSRLKNLTGKQRKLVIRALKNKFLIKEVIANKSGLEAAVAELLRLSRVNKIRELDSLLEEWLHRQATAAWLSGKNIKAIRFYKRYLQFFRKGNYSIEATVRLGLLYRKIKDLGASRNYFMRAATLYRNKKSKLSYREKSFAAQARLERLYNLEMSYKNIAIRLPESRLQKDIQRKLSNMERLNKGYLEVLDYGDGKWSIEAIYRTALSYLEFANALKNTPTPKEYDKEKEAKFRAQLQSISKPVLQKVIETFNLAIKRGNALVVAAPVMAKVYVASSLRSARKGRYPLAYDLNWKPEKWIVGKVGTDEDIQLLLKNPKKLSLIVAVGNRHLMNGNELLAKVFYNRAISIGKRYSAAISNLAYIEGRNGDTQAALAGFKQALESSEFNKQIRKNIGRIYMASGLWRHSRAVYRRLSSYTINDKEVSRGLGFSYLALGQLQKAKEFLDGNLENDVNSQFAKAVLDLAKGDEDDAKSTFRSLDSRSIYAKMITDFWKN